MSSVCRNKLYPYAIARLATTASYHDPPHLSSSTLYSVGNIVKVKLNLEQATKAQRGSRNIALLFL
jgi:hypothetical protein